MLVRTTISLQDQYIKGLKKILDETQGKSLSTLFNTIVQDFLARHKKKQLLQTMEQYYKNYADNFDESSFHNMEEAALTDFIKNNEPYENRSR